MMQQHQLGRSLGWGFVAIAVGFVGPTGPALAAGLPLAPIVRPTSNHVPQLPVCYGSMPNQAIQNMDALCSMGKPKPQPGIDMVTDRDQDGVPDALAAEFRKMDAAMRAIDGMGRRESPAAQLSAHQMATALREMNERMPYSAASKATMREMTQLMEQHANPYGDVPAPVEQRLVELNKQMEQDPMVQQIRNYYDRFEENKSEKSRSR
jgi:hypothetical protein